MKCPSCGRLETYVCEDRLDSGRESRTRRYRCDICGQKFYTKETIMKPIDKAVKTKGEINNA